MNSLLLGIALCTSSAVETPGVRVALIIPPGEQPWSEARERLDTVLKDTQWWYGCQMEAFGYGHKTFSLEKDAAGKVVVHEVRLTQVPELPADVDRMSDQASGMRSGVIIEAEKVLGNPSARKGTVMVLAYNGYYWTDRNQLKMLPMGFGANGRWAHFTGWHLFGVNPKGWTDTTPVPALAEQNPFFPPIATKVYQLNEGDGVRSVGERSSVSHGIFVHEIGHAFGLHHPEANSAKVLGDCMTGDFWNIRGNFLAEMKNDWTCLTSAQAAALNKNPLFQRRENTGPPSHAAPKELGMKGASDQVFKRRDFASLDLGGSGYLIEALGQGQKSQSNRDYIWRHVPPGLEGFRYTRTAGGVKASIYAQARTAGRVLVSTAEHKAPALLQSGWRMTAPTLTYSSTDLKRNYVMYMYEKSVKAGTTLDIPQCEWSGTVVIGP